MLSRLVRQILQATVYDVAIETPLDAGAVDSVCSRL